MRLGDAAEERARVVERVAKHAEANGGLAGGTQQRARLGRQRARGERPRGGVLEPSSQSPPVAEDRGVALEERRLVRQTPAHRDVDPPRPIAAPLRRSLDARRAPSITLTPAVDRARSRACSKRSPLAPLTPASASPHGQPTYADSAAARSCTTPSHGGSTMAAKGRPHVTSASRSLSPSQASRAGSS